MRFPGARANITWNPAGRANFAQKRPAHSCRPFSFNDDGCLASLSLSIFPDVENPENEDIGIGHFIANFVVAHQNSPHFAWLKFCESRPKTRISGDAFRARDQLSNDASRGGDVDSL
jgi:hypothetical protein